MNDVHSEIPAAMVEAAARAHDEHRWTQYAYGYGRHGLECSCGFKRDDVMEDEAGSWSAAYDAVIGGHLAAVMLAAALAECEVREEFGHSRKVPGEQWHAHRCPTSDLRRLVVVTPAQEETAQ